MVSCWLQIAFMSMKGTYILSVLHVMDREQGTAASDTAEAHFDRDLSLVYISITFILGRNDYACTVICCYNCSICGQYGKLYHGCLLTISPGKFCLNAPYWIPAGLCCLCSLQVWWPVCSPTSPSPSHQKQRGMAALLCKAIVTTWILETYL